MGPGHSERRWQCERRNGLERREKIFLLSSRLSSPPPDPGRLLLFEEPSCKGTKTNHRTGDRPHMDPLRSG